MQSDIKKIVEWCETWSMKLSPEKCKIWKQMHPEHNIKHNI